MPRPFFRNKKSSCFQKLPFFLPFWLTLAGAAQTSCGLLISQKEETAEEKHYLRTSLILLEPLLFESGSASLSQVKWTQKACELSRPNDTPSTTIDRTGQAATTLIQANKNSDFQEALQKQGNGCIVFPESFNLKDAQKTYRFKASAERAAEANLTVFVSSQTTIALKLRSRTTDFNSETSETRRVLELSREKPAFSLTTELIAELPNDMGWTVKMRPVSLDISATPKERTEREMRIVYGCLGVISWHSCDGIRTVGHRMAIVAAQSTLPQTFTEASNLAQTSPFLAVPTLSSLTSAGAYFDLINRNQLLDSGTRLWVIVSANGAASVFEITAP